MTSTLTTRPPRTIPANFIMPISERTEHRGRQVTPVSRLASRNVTEAGRDRADPPRSRVCAAQFCLFPETLMLYHIYI
jgi:hypothetical protein